MHRIRLSAAWERLSPAAADDRRRGDRSPLPLGLSGDAEERGTAVLRRRFHSPNGLDADKQLVVALVADTDQITVTLNGSGLAPQTTGELDAALSRWAGIDPLPLDEPSVSPVVLWFDVSEGLQSFNEITVRRSRDESRDGDRGRLFAAWLEIRAASS